MVPRGRPHGQGKNGGSKQCRGARVSLVLVIRGVRRMFVLVARAHRRRNDPCLASVSELVVAHDRHSIDLEDRPMATTTGQDTAQPLAAGKPGRWIADWRPEDTGFWERGGARVARRNLVFSIFSEHVGFSVWSLWSVFVGSS